MSFPGEQFPNSEALLRRLQEKSDNFDSVTIMVTNDLLMSKPGARGHRLTNCCGVLKTCSGESIVIHRDDLEALLNDGILHRQRIPIKLLPQLARPEGG